MSNFVGSGTITTNTTTSSIACRGWATLSVHLDSGSGTWTWQFKGPDDVWRNIIGGSDFITSQAYTATNMINVFFGTDVRVRGNATSGSSPQWDWQIMSTPFNRPGT